MLFQNSFLIITYQWEEKHVTLEGTGPVNSILSKLLKISVTGIYEKLISWALLSNETGIYHALCIILSKYLFSRENYLTNINCEIQINCLVLYENVNVMKDKSRA